MATRSYLKTNNDTYEDDVKRQEDLEPFLEEFIPEIGAEFKPECKSKDEYESIDNHTCADGSTTVFCYAIDDDVFFYEPEPEYEEPELEDDEPDLEFDDVDEDNTNDLNVAKTTKDVLSLYEESESKKKWVLSNGRGRLLLQKKKSSSNAPSLKGTIKLNKRVYFLSGWIRTVKSKEKSSYISLMASVKEKASDENVSYVTKGIGYLRYAHQTNPKQPSYRGQVEITECNEEKEDRKFFSLSAWRTSTKGIPMLSLYSHPIKTVSYSESQRELEKWDKNLEEE